MNTCIPSDIWLDTVLQMLDARDIAVLVEARLLPTTAAWPLGAVFVAKRVLRADEVEWFAANRIPVTLLPVKCCQNQPYYATHAPHMLGAATPFPTYQWTLTHSGQLHRDHDLPAAVWEQWMHVDACLCEWWHDGKLHRDNGEPAIVYSSDHDGYRLWYIHGKQHRGGDLPAAEYTHSGNQWWYNGELHRENDQPAVEYANDNGKEWWYAGKRHRENDRPAVDVNSRREWWVHGRLHRWWGPAVEWSDGLRKWYWYGFNVKYIFAGAFLAMTTIGAVRGPNRETNAVVGTVINCAVLFCADRAAYVCLLRGYNHWIIFLVIGLSSVVLAQALVFCVNYVLF